MSKEPIKFLDTVLKPEEDNINDEKPYNQERRTFSISRSGRFKSRNKRRESLDTNLFRNNQELNLTSSSSNHIDNQNQIDKIHNKDSNLTNFSNHSKNEQSTSIQENQNQGQNDKLTEFFETPL